MESAAARTIRASRAAGLRQTGISVIECAYFLKKNGTSLFSFCMSETNQLRRLRLSSPNSAHEVHRRHLSANIHRGCDRKFIFFCFLCLNSPELFFYLLGLGLGLGLAPLHFLNTFFGSSVSIRRRTYVRYSPGLGLGLEK